MIGGCKLKKILLLFYLALTIIIINGCKDKINENLESSKENKNLNVINYKMINLKN